MDKPSTGVFSRIPLMETIMSEKNIGMKKSPLTNLTRAYFFVGALLVLAFLLTVGPYMAKQTVNIWMAFGAGLALIAYGRTNVRRRWVSVLSMMLGTIWIGALIFTIFGIARL